MDDGRTHDSTSAIDDDIIPGAGNIFNEIPQAQHKEGDMALVYNMQTFNELVSANTALQSELAGRDSLITSLEDQLKQAEGAKAEYELVVDKHVGRIEKDLTEARDLLAEERGSHEHTRRLLATANQRVARASGYIDRVLDDEQRLDDPVKLPAPPAPPAPRGPALNDIGDPPAPYRTRLGTDDNLRSAIDSFSPARRPDHEYAPRRRY